MWPFIYTNLNYRPLSNNYLLPLVEICSVVLENKTTLTIKKDNRQISISKPHLIFRFHLSSPDLKAQVSSYDRQLSIALLSVNFFPFSSSSPEPLGQFQPNLVQSIPGQGEFNSIFSNEGPTLLIGGDNNDIANIHYKISFSWTTWQISTKLDIKHH